MQTVAQDPGISPMESVGKANEVWNYHAETPAELASLLLKSQFHNAHPMLYPDFAQGNPTKEDGPIIRELMDIAMRFSYVYRAPYLAQVVAGIASNWSLQSRAVGGWQQQMLVTREVRVKESQTGPGGGQQPRRLFDRPYQGPQPGGQQ